ncbi:TIGR03808 family TAT-translocated repetitive protein [Devosia sp. PTR5]|uniref:TIGR03808 family TAT-translocated repetitive protein n=1 Tax=Devosia oryzisoli TaxID=2774138 RepID=A0A927FTW7_9HYPH|nr:TIGR03808 family TAT-translocated repetitive protein [Devosia oryzisoli]MBD8065377.1 TIGR03808 family TAT-translocated repetitive protein [Devosia oryzisoli]
MKSPRLTRRAVTLGGLAVAAAALVPGLTLAQEFDPASTADQTGALQAAIDAAAPAGRLLLPPGRFRVSGLRLPSSMTIEGIPGATWLVAQGAAIGAISSVSNLTLRDIGFVGDSGSDALLAIERSSGVTLTSCLFRDSPGMALQLSASAAIIDGCDFSGHGDAAIHAMDSTGLFITGNRIARCGNAGIRIWRSESGADNSIVRGNVISEIDWRDGGNGQNGNGINVFRADNVIVGDNAISGCAFSAIRLNATRNAQVSGNQCLASGEVAIFSEFGFSGSIIANNVVDGAAGGISMTNLDAEGHMAVCSGNIVRTIAPSSAVNPDTRPFGIFAEADAAIAGNVVDGVPGIAIGAGWGPYLRNVAISGNVVTNSRIGIGVSVAEGAGAVTITGNQLDATEHAIAGMRWTQVAEPDLAAAADRYPQLSFR